MANDKIEKTIKYVKQELQNVEAGHDWFHVERVWKLAKTIALEENVNTEVIEYAALLHDIADSKFNNGDEEIGPKKAFDFLKYLNVNEEVILHVVSIIKNMSFKSSFGKIEFTSLEMQIVQDADRLDAIGAIGIARTFNYGGFKNREIYNPAIAPNLDMDKETYKNSTAPTINHFYEKLLLLKDKMNTNTGKKIALKRHEFMLSYLEQFYQEWEGKN